MVVPEFIKARIFLGTLRFNQFNAIGCNIQDSVPYEEKENLYIMLTTVSVSLSVRQCLSWYEVEMWGQLFGSKRGILKQALFTYNRFIYCMTY